MRPRPPRIALRSLALSLAIGGPAFAAPSAPAPSSKSDKADKAPGIDKAWLQPYFRTGKTAAAAELYRLDNFAAAVPAFEAAVAALPARHPERGAAAFMLALSRMNAGQWAAAAAAFEALRGEFPLLADYHTYYAARCHLRAGNPSAALAWADKVEANAVADAEAQLVALEALERLEQWEQVERRAQTYLQKYEAGPRRAEARFRLAYALEKLRRSPAEIVPHYRAIWSYAPTETWAAKAEERIKVIALTMQKPEADVVAPKAQDWFARAMALHEKHQNTQADPAFAEAIKALGARDDAKLACQARFYRGQAVFKLRQRTQATPHYEDAEALYRAAW